MNPNKVIHAKEIEDFLYCRERWKKSSVMDQPDVSKAFGLRERLWNVLSPKLPIFMLPDPLSSIQKFALRTAVFIFVCFFYDPLPFLLFLVLLLVLTSTSPNILHAILVKKAQKEHQEEYDLEIDRLEKEIESLSQELKEPNQLFATEYAFPYQKESDDWEQREDIYYEFVLYDNDILWELDEEDKICRVILDRSNEKLPYYIPMAHKYHILRVEAQAKILESYFPNYEIKVKIVYANGVSKYGQYSNEKKITNELRYILRTIHDKNQKTIPIAYRCIRCPHLDDCKYARKEAIEINEPAANA